MTSQSAEQIKPFADRNIYSLLMQVREAYRESDWMMDLELFERGFRVFWGAGVDPASTGTGYTRAAFTEPVLRHALNVVHTHH